MAKNFLNNLYRNINQMDKLQTQLSSSKKFQIPSDDPTGVVKSMGLTSSLTELEQYQRNISKGVSHLEATDTSINQYTDLLKRARDLTIEGSNATMSQTERDAIASEFDQIIESVFTISNTTVEGKAIFAGFKTLDSPFEMLTSMPKDLYDENGEKLAGYIEGKPTQFVYKGDNGDISKQVEKGINIKVNITGADLFSNVLREEIISGRDNVASPTSTLDPSYDDQEFEIWVDDKATKVTLTPPKGSSLSGIADAINTSRAGVTASVVQDNTGASALKIVADKKGFENSFILSSISKDPDPNTGEIVDYSKKGGITDYVLDDYIPSTRKGGLGLTQRVDSVSEVNKAGADFRDIKDIPLANLTFTHPTEGLKTGESDIINGNIVINGYNILVEKGTDTLNSIAKKINDSDIDVRVSFDENDNMVFESVGAIEIIDDKSNFLQLMGVVDDQKRVFKEQGEKTKASGAFDILMDIRNDLLKGDTESLSKGRVKELDDAITHSLNLRTQVGARLNRFEQISSRMEDVNINLQKLLSLNEDVDFPKAITDLQLMENIHQATLQIGGKIIPPTLMNFI
jgi:flagellar hook-associated protein 3